MMSTFCFMVATPPPRRDGVGNPMSANLAVDLIVLSTFAAEPAITVPRAKTGPGRRGGPYAGSPPCYCTPFCRQIATHVASNRARERSLLGCSGQARQRGAISGGSLAGNDSGESKKRMGRAFPRDRPPLRVPVVRGCCDEPSRDFFSAPKPLQCAFQGRLRHAAPLFQFCSPTIDLFDSLHFPR
jgi:hypothetical protein